MIYAWPVSTPLQYDGGPVPPVDWGESVIAVEEAVVAWVLATAAASSWVLQTTSSTPSSWVLAGPSVTPSAWVLAGPSVTPSAWVAQTTTASTWVAQG